MMTIQQRELMVAATKLLNQLGLRWDGRPTKDVVKSQVAFERRMRPNPFCGRSTKR